MHGRGVRVISWQHGFQACGQVYSRPHDITYRNLCSHWTIPLTNETSLSTNSFNSVEETGRWWAHGPWPHLLGPDRITDRSIRCVSSFLVKVIHVFFKGKAREIRKGIYPMGSQIEYMLMFFFLPSLSEYFFFSFFFFHYPKTKTHILICYKWLAIDCTPIHVACTFRFELIISYFLNE